MPIFRPYPIFPSSISNVNRLVDIDGHRLSGIDYRFHRLIAPGFITKALDCKTVSLFFALARSQRRKASEAGILAR